MSALVTYCKYSALTILLGVTMTSCDCDDLTPTIDDRCFGIPAPEIDSVAGYIEVQCWHQIPPARSLDWFDYDGNSGVLEPSEDTTGCSVLRTWGVTDSCGSETVITQRIFVNIEGRFDNAPANFETFCGNSDFTRNLAWTDGCDSFLFVPAVLDTISTNSCCPEAVILTWRHVDRCENITEHVQRIDFTPQADIAIEVLEVRDSSAGQNELIYIAEIKVTNQGSADAFEIGVITLFDVNGSGENSEYIESLKPGEMRTFSEYSFITTPCEDKCVIDVFAQYEEYCQDNNEASCIWDQGWSCD